MTASRAAGKRCSDRSWAEIRHARKMGTLTFTDLEINMLSGDAALVLGRWRLKRANDEPHGTFYLAVSKDEGRLADRP